MNSGAVRSAVWLLVFSCEIHDEQDRRVLEVRALPVSVTSTGPIRPLNRACRSSGSPV